jgi:hypothetical protein
MEFPGIPRTLEELDEMDEDDLCDIIVDIGLSPNHDTYGLRQQLRRFLGLPINS